MPDNPLAALALLIRKGADEAALARLIEDLSLDDAAVLRSLRWGGKQHTHSPISFIGTALWLYTPTAPAQHAPPPVGSGCTAGVQYATVSDGRRKPRD